MNNTEEKTTVVNNNVNNVTNTNNVGSFNDLATKKVINFDTTPIVDVVNYIL